MEVCHTGCLFGHHGSAYCREIDQGCPGQHPQAVRGAGGKGINLIDTPNRLHMAMDLTIDGPIDACGRIFLTEDRVNEVYDRGEGKGVVADCAIEVYERAGRLLLGNGIFEYSG